MHPPAGARIAWICASLVCLHGGTALADSPAPRDFVLQWLAPPECPNAERVRADIERLTGRSGGESTEKSGVTIVATAARRGTDRWVVDLLITTPNSEPSDRHVEGGTCREVADAAAVIVAISLDPSRPLPEPPTPVPPPIPVPTPPPISTPPPTLPPPTPSSGITWELGVVGGIDVAALPSPASGLGVYAAITQEKNRFELRGAAWLPRASAFSPSSGVDVGLYTGAVRFCRVLVGHAIQLGACAGVEAGALRAQAFGLRENGSGAGRWLAPELGVIATAHVSSHFALTIEGDGLAAIVRDRFLIDTTLTYRPPPADGRVLLGMRLEGL